MVPAPGTSAGPDVGSSECIVREVSRDSLFIREDQAVAMMPEAFAVSGGKVLIAGGHSRLTTRDTTVPKPFWGMTTLQDSIFGAIIELGRGARLIPMPIPPRPIRGARAVPLNDGTFAVTFAEMYPGYGRYGNLKLDDSISALWYGVFDGERWTALERVPTPRAEQVAPFSFRLLQHGDTLFLAATIWIPPHGFVLFERRAGDWTHEVSPTFLTQVALAHTDTLGLILAVVQPDSLALPDGNSLILRRHHPALQRLRRIVYGSVEGRAYSPVLSLGENDDVLTWLAQVPSMPSRRFETRVMIGRLLQRNEPVLVVDSATDGWSLPYYRPLPNGTGLWVVNHKTASGEREIRFVHRVGRSTRLVGRFPHSFLGWFNVTEYSPTDVLVTAPVMDPSNHLTFNLLRRFRLECRPTA